MADHNNKDFLQKLHATFRAEAQDHLQGIESNIVLLEQSGEGAQKELVGHILKKLHTLKGAARAVSLTEMEMLCHAMESVFTTMGASSLALTSEQFDLIHQSIRLAQVLVLEPSGKSRNQAKIVIGRLEHLSATLSHSKNQEAGTPTVWHTEQAALQQPAENDAQNLFLSSEPPEPVQSDMIRVQGKNLDAIRYQVESLLSVELGLQHHINDLLAIAEDIADYSGRVQIMQRIIGTDGKRKRVGRSEQGMSFQFPPGQHHHEAIGSLTALAEFDNQIELRCRRLAGALSRTRRNFQVARSKLIDATLETALVPFSSALDPLPGLVRNLARSQGKEAVLSVEGESIQIDRRVLENIREALIHLVTNAVDHGIEPTESRLAHGKKAAGTIQVTVAQVSGNQVAVTVADDGTGMDVPGLIASASKGIYMQASQIEAFSDQQKLFLATQPGVSTSEKITQVSGRGVGLSIVADKVASLGGEMVIDHAKGRGCSFRLILPVRLATLRGLVLQTKGFRYVLPLSGVERVRSLKEGDIQTVENRETLTVGNRIVPVIRLGHLLGHGRSGEKSSNDENIAVIARAGGNLLALLADEILSEQEVLPKSLGKQLRRVRYMTGATQLGDGRLVPILGLDDIAKYGLVNGVAETPENSRAANLVQTKRLLVTEDSITSRLLLKHILESEGYLVETAVDGLDALSKLRNENFDALVSDIEMPRMDGLALTKNVRANPKTADMPVILVTSLQSPEEKERGLQAGADAYVVKGSFDQDNLMAAIRRLI